MSFFFLATGRSLPVSFPRKSHRKRRRSHPVIMQHQKEIPIDIAVAPVVGLHSTTASDLLLLQVQISISPFSPLHKILASLAHSVLLVNLSSSLTLQKYGHPSEQKNFCSISTCSHQEGKENQFYSAPFRWVFALPLFFHLLLIKVSIFASFLSRVKLYKFMGHAAALQN